MGAAGGAILGHPRKSRGRADLECGNEGKDDEHEMAGRPGSMVREQTPKERSWKMKEDMPANASARVLEPH